MSQEDKLVHLRFSKEYLKSILSIFVNISLTLLPIFASDFPSEDRHQFYLFLMKWFKIAPKVVDHYIDLFGGAPITMRDFISKCEEHKIFDVLSIRLAAQEVHQK